jgi:hypothetical protein
MPASSGHPPARRTRGRRAGAVAHALRFALYLAVCWSVPLALAWGLPRAVTWAVVAAAVYTTLPLVAFIRWRGWPFYPRGAFRVLVVRGVLYGQLLLPLVAAAGALGLVAGAPFGASLVVGRATAGAALAAAAAVLVAGYLGSRALVVREVDAHVPGLPPEFDGLRIAQLSDLHVGPHTSRRFLRRVVRAVSGLDPDLVAVTGDLVDDRAEDVAPYAASLGALRAPLGVFVIPGNHDVYAGWDEVERALRESTDATVLVNDARVVERDGARLALVGLGDPAARAGVPIKGGPSGGGAGASRAAPDIDRAFARVPSDVVAVAFAHNPVLWPPLAERGAALTLSGHTHWGQLALPSLGWSLASPFLEHAMGGHRLGDSLLYIHPGTGYWGLPFRLGALPEVTLVRLRRAERAELTVGERRRAACRRAA